MIYCHAMYMISISVGGRHFCLCIDLLGGPPVCICCVQNNKSWDHFAPDKKPLFHVYLCTYLWRSDDSFDFCHITSICFETSRPGCGAFKCTGKVRQLLKRTNSVWLSSTFLSNTICRHVSSALRNGAKRLQKRVHPEMSMRRKREVGALTWYTEIMENLPV